MKCKRLNLIDIVNYKKDFLWGKYYYSCINKGEVVDTVLYSYPYGNKKLIEIHDVDKKHHEFVRDFTKTMSKKEKIRYFIREMSEINHVSDIQFMNECGFKRYSRNYCFDFDLSYDEIRKNYNQIYFCREADKRDIQQLIEIDTSSQVLEFRDELHRSKKYFKDNLLETYVLTMANNTNKIVAYMLKKNLDHHSTFELVLPSRMSEAIQSLLMAFCERYIYFEKVDDNFRFIIDESHKKAAPEIEKKFPLKWSSQKLIYEGAPKEKIVNPQASINFSQAPVA